MVGSPIGDVAATETGKGRGKRPYMPKARTGCLTCKIRRVKCDEGKPDCHRCVSTGRKCDGYSALPAKSWRLGVADQETVAAAPMQPWASALVHFGEPKERRALQFFLERTASTLSGYVGSYFWSSLLPQASHTQPALKHILVATASVHEYLHADYSHVYDRKFIDEHYHRAINSLARTEKPPALEIVLMACLLFTCCEFLQGHFRASIMHIESGLKIMRDWRSGKLADSGSTTRSLVASTKSASDIIRTRIGPILASFAAKASLYGVCQEETHRYDSSTFGKPVIPSQIHDLHESSHCLAGIIQWLMYAMGNPKGASNRPSEVPGVREVQQLLMEWSTSFEGFEGRCRSANEQEQKTAQHLRIHLQAATIMAHGFPSETESIYYDFTGRFRFIVEQTKALLAPKDPVVVLHISPDKQSTFTFNLGLIPPLFLTAVRCRDPTLRRTALYLLQSLNRVEGLWDSCTAAKIAETVIRVEEKGLSLLHSAADVTEYSRIRLDKVDLDPEDPHKVFLWYKRSPFSLSSKEQETVVAEQEQLLWTTCDHTDAIQWPLQALLHVVGCQGLLRSVPAHNPVSGELTKSPRPANTNSFSLPTSDGGIIGAAPGGTSQPLSNFNSENAPSLFWCPSIFGKKGPPSGAKVPSSPRSNPEGALEANKKETQPPWEWSRVASNVLIVPEQKRMDVIGID